MTRTAVRRTQTERRQESEARLIRGAIDIIARQGVGALTFEAISRQSGMSRGSVTQRFGSKEGLIEAILIHLHEDQQARLQARDMDTLSGRAAISAYIDLAITHMGQTGDVRAYYLLLSSSLEDTGGLGTRFRETHAEVAQQLQAWIGQGQATGDIAPAIDGKATALMIGCMIFGIAMQLLTDPDMNIWAVRDAALQMVGKSLRG